MFKITNTLTGNKETFTTLHPGKVLLYVCGITPYDRSHIGHARSCISFDVLYRWLVFLGYDVTYCRNFTDIDDKLLHKAAQQFGDPLRYKEVADTFIKQYADEVVALNCKQPTHEPRVTDNIPAIIHFIEGLIQKGYAYQANGDVYFRVAKFPEYGKLSKQQRDELRAGARIEVDKRKEDPLDFALWKNEKTGTFWKSPWGHGRPGWHIECSVLASKYLGDCIDIHGGGLDLIFPHHENEIAQSEALYDKTFARYWVHNGFVQVENEKMSKSLGNVIAIDDLLKKYDPMVVRFYFLNHHYRAPLDFSFEDLDGAQKSYKRLCNVFKNAEVGKFTLDQLRTFPIITRMLDFLADDLNTTGMLGVVFEQLDALVRDTKQLQAAKQIFHDVLGLSLIPIPEKQVALTPEAEKLIAERELARKNKDWARADALRDQLAQLGFEIRDEKMKK